MEDLDTLVEKVRRRVFVWGRKKRVWAGEALTEAAELVRLIDGDHAVDPAGFAKAVEAVGRLHWARYTTGGSRDEGELLAAMGLFSLLKTVAPHRVPGAVKDLVVAVPRHLLAGESGLVRFMWDGAATELVDRVIGTGTVDGVPDAVYLWERVLAATGPDDPSRPRHVFNLGNAWHLIAQHLANAAGLRRALELVEESLAATRQDDPDHAARSALRAAIVKDLHYVTGDPTLLVQAVEIYEDVLGLIPDDHIDRAVHVLNYCDAGAILFETSRDEDLADRVLNELAGLYATGDPPRQTGQVLSRLMADRFGDGTPEPEPEPEEEPATPELRAFEQTGKTAHLTGPQPDSGLLTWYRALYLGETTGLEDATTGPEALRRFAADSEGLRADGLDLETAALIHEVLSPTLPRFFSRVVERLRTRPSSPVLTGYLGLAHDIRHHLEGDPGDEASALRLLREALDGPLPEHRRGLFLAYLGDALSHTPAGLDEAIELYEQATRHTPPPPVAVVSLFRAHAARQDADAMLAVARRFLPELPQDSPEWREITGNIGLGLAERALHDPAADLDEAIDMLAVTQDGTSLTTLMYGSALRLRHLRRQDPADLDRSLAAYGGAAGAEPLLVLFRLGELLQWRHALEPRPALLDAAIGFLRGAVALSDGHELATTSREELARALACRAEDAGRPDDLDEAIETARRTADFLLLGDLLALRHPEEPPAAALLQAALADVADGSLDIEQAEAAMPPFADDEATLGALLRQTAEATLVLGAGATEQALRLARLLVAGLRDTTDDAVLAKARAEASLILVDSAREVLSRRADPALYHAAHEAGSWVARFAEEIGEAILAGTAAFRLGTLNLELYGRYTTPGWERRGRERLLDPAPLLPGHEGPGLPDPVTALRTAAGHLARAAGLRTGEARGEAARRVAAALYRLRERGEPIDEAELDAAVETALQLLPDDAYGRRLGMLAMRPGPERVAGAERALALLEADLDEYMERAGAEAALAAAVTLARLLAGTAPARALDLLTKVAAAAAEPGADLDESVGVAQVCSWQIKLLARIHDDDLGRLLTEADLATAQDGDPQRGLAALGRVDRDDPRLGGFRQALHFLEARLSATAAEHAEGSEQVGLAAAAVHGFTYAGATQYALLVIESFLMPAGAGLSDDDAIQVLAILGVVAKFVPLTSPGTTELLQRFYARLLAGLLTTGTSEHTLGVLLSQAKGSRLGEVLLAGPPALADPEPVAFTVPAAAQETLDELMVVAWADSRHRRPADSEEGRLRNRQRAFDAEITEKVLAHRTVLPYATLKLGGLMERLGERTALIIYLPILSAGGRGGLAHLIVTADAIFVGQAWDDHPAGDIAVVGDTAFTVSTLGTDVAGTRQLLQEDPGPAPVTAEAPAFLVNPLLFGRESLDHLAGLRASGHDRLLVAPHGPYHFFPFHLAGPERGRWLDDWKTGYLPNLDLLLRPAAAIGEGTLTSIGLDYLGTEHPPLHEAVAEASACAAAFATTPVLNAAATRAAVLAALRGSRHVHLAAHGSHNIDAPVLQAVHLADGPLFAYDLLGLDLTGLELVTLSACETGLGRIDRADNLRGIPAALFVAGVRFIVATLWPVSDETAAYFFPRLYAGLAEGKGIWDAFHDVRHLTRRQFPQYRDWGAFVLMGGDGDD
ncbi:CHAT domain-containing protein [Nonomuraea sp. NPDC050547]|uniref:CHAT domain-containing protein n=1 Tax=Nonomuraea sp. NPDC050547 TaxID=3364368 RepID=UPI0037A53579